MKRIFTLLTFVISILSVCTLSVTEGYAQLTGDNYPVQAHVYVQRPSLKMPEYFSSTTMLRTDLILKDLTKTTLDVYLGWQITGLGLAVEAGTLPGFVPPNFLTLTKGSKRQLSGAELREYFQPGMLAVSGVGENVIFNGKLPEGFYTIKITAYEAGTGRQVSNTAETFFSVAYALPPVINLPLIGSEQPVTRPQSVLLQWMPRHTATGSNRITYSGKVCEVAEDEDPNIAINGSQNCFTLPAQPGTSYVLKASDLPLKVGKRYAFQVQVTDNNEQLEFQNQGYSEVSWFRFGEACKPPSGIRISQLSPGRIHLSWNLKTEALGYKIFYKASDESVWSETTTIMPGVTFPNLDASKSYVFKVATLCDIQDESEPSAEIPWVFEQQDDELPEDLITKVLNPEWETPDDVNELVSSANDPLPKTLEDLIDPTKIPCSGQVNNYEQCSDDHPAVVTNAGTEQQTALAPGDLITVYDYVVVVTSATHHGGGVWSGKGLARVEFMQGSMMPVEFSNVTIMKDPNQPRGGCVTIVPEGGYFRVRSGMSYGDIKKEELEIINAARCKMQPEDCKLVTFDVTLDDYREQSTEIKDDLCEATAVSQQKIDSYISTARQSINNINGWIENITALDNTSEKLDFEKHILLLQETKIALERNIECLQAGTCKCEEFGPIDLSYIIDLIKNSIENIIDVAKDNELAPRITDLHAIDVDTETAAIKWGHDERFKQYKITLESADGQTQTYYIQATDEEDFNAIFELEGLSEDTQYYVKLEAYTEDGLADVAYTTFTTKAVEIPKPYNVKIGELSDNKVKITWEKDPLHESYIIEYTGPDGVTHRITTTDPEAFLEIGDDGRYNFTIVAVGKNGKESEPYTGSFEMEKECYNFKSDIKLSSGTFGEEKTVSPGTEVTLSLQGGIMTGACQRPVIWYKGEEEIGTGTGVKTTVAETTTYRAVCNEVNNGPNSAVTQCEKSITLTVIPFCENTEISASKTQVSDGEKILLTRTMGCQAATESYWTNTQGEVIGNSENVFVTPKHGERNVWYLNCKNGTEICRTPSPAIEVKDPCDDMILWFPRSTMEHVLLNVAGCEADLQVRLINAGGVKKMKNYWYSKRGYHKDWIDGLGGRSVLFDFEDHGGQSFTISVKCGDKCDWKEIVFEKSTNCQRNWCEAYVDANSIAGTDLVDVKILGSHVTNSSLEGFYDNVGAKFESVTAFINYIPVAGQVIYGVYLFSKLFFGNWFGDIIGGWFNNNDVKRSCGGGKYIYYYKGEILTGNAMIAERKPHRQLLNIDRIWVSAEGDTSSSCNPLQVMIPAVADTEVYPPVNENGLPAHEITELNNDKEYITLTGCSNEFEEGLWMLKTSEGVELVKPSQLSPIRRGYKKWSLNAACLLSGNIYTTSVDGAGNLAADIGSGVQIATLAIQAIIAAGAIADRLFASTADVASGTGVLSKVCSAASFVGSVAGWGGLGFNPREMENLYAFAEAQKPHDPIFEAPQIQWPAGTAPVFRVYSPPGNRCGSTYPKSPLIDWTRVYKTVKTVVHTGAVIGDESINMLPMIKQVFDNAKKGKSFAAEALTDYDIDEVIESTLDTYMPIEGIKVSEYRPSSGKLPETYLGDNVAKKVLNDLCSKLDTHNMSPDKREEAICKVYNNLREAGATLLPNPQENPEALEAFNNGDCSAIQQLWAINGQPIDQAAAETALSKNTAVLEDAGSGECRNEMNDNLTVNVTQTRNPNCNNQQGLIKVTASGGTSPYQYSVSLRDGSYKSGWTTSDEFKDLPAGEYIITARDNTQNNYGSAGAILSATAQMNIQLAWEHSDCSEPYQRRLVPTVTGGAGSYQYAYGDGAFSPTLTVPHAAKHEVPVRVKDATDCVQEEKIPARVTRQLNVTATTAPPACGQSDGTISLNISCGDGTYTVIKNGNSMASSSQTEYTGLAAGSYSFRVMDTDGNRGEVSVTLESGDGPLQLTVETEPATCAVDGATITLNASGGCGEYQYSIDGGQTYTEESVFRNLDLGTYRIAVKDKVNTTVTDEVTFEPVEAEYLISEGRGIAMAMARTAAAADLGGKIVCEIQFDDKTNTRVNKVCLEEWIIGNFDPNTNLLTITGFTDPDPELNKYKGTYYSTFNADNKDIFYNFYRKDFYDGTLSPNPCTASKGLSKGDIAACATCAEGWLPESFFNRECGIRPKELVPNGLTQLIAKMVETGNSNKSYQNPESGVTYDLKIFKSDPNTTVLQRNEIVDQLSALQPNDIALWIDVHEDGSVKYEFFTGSNITLNARQKSLFNQWVEVIDPFIPQLGPNPFVAILEGVADMAKEYMVVPPKYWDCNHADYYRLPWITECTNCLTPTNWALLCGVWEGVVNEATGLVEFVAILADGQKRSEMLTSLQGLMSAETWSAMWDDLEKKHTDKAGKPCQLSHQIGEDITAVGSLVLPITKLSKTKIVASVSNLADNVVHTLAKFKVVGQTSFEVISTVGKGTFEIAKDAYDYTRLVVKAEVYWATGNLYKRTFFGKSYELVTDAGGYIARAGDGEILYATELMRDAESILLKMEKTVAGKKEEVLAVVRRATRLTQQQLEDLYESIKNNSPSEFKAGTDEHMAQRWAQYKESGREYPYDQWANTYDANMVKARLANAKVSQYYDDIAFNCPAGKNCKEVTQNVIVNGEQRVRRLDIADNDPNVLHGIEVKAYETGKVYKTQDIIREIEADAYLIRNENWRIQWKFIDCELSVPLRQALIDAGIEII